MQEVLRSTKGVFAIEDNLPFSQEQLIFELNERGRALGLTETDLGQQLRAGFWGVTVQTDYSPNEET